MKGRAGGVRKAAGAECPPIYGRKDMTTKFKSLLMASALILASVSALSQEKLNAT